MYLPAIKCLCMKIFVMPNKRIISIFINCPQNREQDIQFYEAICNNNTGYVRFPFLTDFNFKILLSGLNQLLKFLFINC